MAPSPRVPYYCICANPIYKDISRKLAVLKLNGPPPHPVIQANLAVNSCRSGTYTVMLAEARQQGTCHPTSSRSPRGSTGYRQGAAALLLSFQQEVMALDLPCELPCWPQRHIVDGQPLEPFESRSRGNSGSTVFSKSVHSRTCILGKSQHSTVQLRLSHVGPHMLAE